MWSPTEAHTHYITLCYFLHSTVTLHWPLIYFSYFLLTPAIFLGHSNVLQIAVVYHWPLASLMQKVSLPIMAPHRRLPTLTFSIVTMTSLVITMAHFHVVCYNLTEEWGCLVKRNSLAHTSIYPSPFVWVLYVSRRKGSQPWWRIIQTADMWQITKSCAKDISRYNDM